MIMIDIKEIELDSIPLEGNRFRSYDLWAIGNTIEEAFENADVIVVDEVGRQLQCFSLKSASQELQKRGLEIIEDAHNEASYWLK